MMSHAHSWHHLALDPICPDLSFTGIVVTGFSTACLGAYYHL